MGDVTLTIDGRQVTVPEGTSVLEAAAQAGVNIPSLCYLKDINEIGSCRVCVVEIEGARALAASCVTPAADGMVVHTNTKRVREARRAVLELIISNHPFECLTCVRSGSCELQDLAEAMGIREIRFEGEKAKHPVDESTPSIVRDPDKCILCRRCVSVCEKVQGVSALGVAGRGFDSVVSPAAELPLNDVACTLCGQCVLVCPTGALSEVDSTGAVWEALGDPSKHVVVQTAPAIRVALGEEFGAAPGSIVTGQMVAALRALGFDKVFDTNFTADLTILEEGNELPQAAFGRRQAADDHIVQSGLDQVYRAFLPRHARSLVHVQVAAADVRSIGKNLLCREGRDRPEGHLRGVDNALYSKEV